MSNWIRYYILEGLIMNFFKIGDKYYIDITEKNLKECYQKLRSNFVGDSIGKTKAITGIYSSGRKLRTR